MLGVLTAFAGQSSETCGLSYTSGGSTGYFSLETADNGNVLLELTGDEPNLKFRNNPTSLDYFTVNGEAASGYFDATVFSADERTVILPLKDGVTVPEEATVAFNGTLEWKSDLEGNAWVMGATFSYTYGRICCKVGKLVQVRTIDVQTNSAVLKGVNKCIEDETWTYRLSYKESHSIVYTVINGLPEGGLYELENLYSDSEYDVLFEAAQPDFESGTQFESSAIKFSTLTKGSTSCGLEYTSGGSTIEVSMETMYNGDVRVSISSDEDNTKFRNEGITSDISKYTVNGEPANAYFADPALSTDATYVIIKNIADLPEGAVVSFNDGTIAWSTDVNPNAYVQNKSISHNYGTTCCSATGVNIVRSEGVSMTSAIISIDKNCMGGKPFTYRYTYNVAGSTEKVGPVVFTTDEINLSGLDAATGYEITVEAAYPDYDSPVEYRSSDATFSTLAMNPAPVPSYAKEEVISIFSSTYGGVSDINYDYSFTSTKPYAYQLSSASTLLKCEMKAYEGAGEPQNGILMTLPAAINIEGKDYIHFDVWISDADKTLSPYIGANVRIVGGVFDSWVAFEPELKGDDWKGVDIPLSSFTGLESGNAQYINIIPSTNNTGSLEGNPFSDEAFTIYLDNIFFYAGTPTEAAEASESGVSAYVADGRLYISGLEAGESFQVYSLSNLIYTGKADGSEFSLPVNAGVYIVKTAGAALKLLCK